MIDKILYCIGIAMLFTAFFSLTQVPKWIDFKPFNCGVCLSFWTCILTLPFTELLPYVLYLGWAGYAAYFSMILKRIMFKI
jgi:hypothetical protein